MIKRKEKRFCPDCGLPAIFHFWTWIEGLIEHLIPNKFSNFVPKKIELWMEDLVEKLFISLHIITLKDDFSLKDIDFRSACFIEEARKQGIKIKAMKGPFGYMNHFQMQLGKKKFSFEGLPIADFLSKKNIELIDDKNWVKKKLKKEGFPFVPGRAFWFWEKQKAKKWAIKEIGFPLVVKPQAGSFSRHITTNIKSEEELNKAINKVIKYSPTFIVEEFMANTDVYRATVIDFKLKGCAERIAANVKGDGLHSISELIEIKNKHPYRGTARGNESPLCKIIVSKTTEKLLKEKNYSLDSVPSKGEIVYLEENPFVRLGADVIEVLEKTHPDNIKLFQDIAKFFEARVVGIDFLAEDIALSWKKQKCAVLELNSLPCIEIHQFPSSGKPQNIAAALVQMVFKYYL